MPAVHPPGLCCYGLRDGVSRVSLSRQRIDRGSHQAATRTFADHSSEGIDERVSGMLISIVNRRITNLNGFRVFVREARSFDSKHSALRRLLRRVGVVVVLPRSINQGVEASVELFPVGWQAGYGGQGGGDWGGVEQVIRSDSRAADPQHILRNACAGCPLEGRTT